MLGTGLERKFSGTNLSLTIAEELPTDDKIFCTLLDDSSKPPKKPTLNWPACVFTGKPKTTDAILLRLELGALDQFQLPNGVGMVMSVFSSEYAILECLTDLRPVTSTTSIERGLRKGFDSGTKTGKSLREEVKLNKFSTKCSAGV